MKNLYGLRFVDPDIHSRITEIDLTPDEGSRPTVTGDYVLTDITVPEGGCFEVRGRTVMLPPAPEKAKMTSYYLLELVSGRLVQLGPYDTDAARRSASDQFTAEGRLMFWADTYRGGGLTVGKYFSENER